MIRSAEVTTLVQPVSPAQVLVCVVDCEVFSSTAWVLVDIVECHVLSCRGRYGPDSMVTLAIGHLETWSRYCEVMVAQLPLGGPGLVCFLPVYRGKRSFWLPSLPADLPP